MRSCVRACVRICVPACASNSSVSSSKPNHASVFRSAHTISLVSIGIIKNIKTVLTKVDYVFILTEQRVACFMTCNTEIKNIVFIFTVERK